jgi:hypothetical protein
VRIYQSPDELLVIIPVSEASLETSSLGFNYGVSFNFQKFRHNARTAEREIYVLSHTIIPGFGPSLDIALNPSPVRQLVVLQEILSEMRVIDSFII